VYASANGLGRLGHRCSTGCCSRCVGCRCFEGCLSSAIFAVPVRAGIQYAHLCGAHLGKVDIPLAERVEVVAHSLDVHRGDCEELGYNVHHAVKAAVLVGGPDTKVKIQLHQKAGLAKHEELHAETPVHAIKATGGKRSLKPSCSSIAASEAFEDPVTEFFIGELLTHTASQTEVSLELVGSCCCYPSDIEQLHAKVDEVIAGLALVLGKETLQVEDPIAIPVPLQFVEAMVWEIEDELLPESEVLEAMEVEKKLVDVNDHLGPLPTANQ
jgi:hypothetical protein